MKKYSALFAIVLFASFFVFSTTSCSRGYGCKINENAHVQPNKKGNYKKSKTRSGLFPKGVYKGRK